MTIAEMASAGFPLANITVVDSHMHNGRVAPFFSRFDRYNDLVLQMDCIGVNCGIVSNLWDTGELWKRHPEIISMCEEYRGRFFGYIAPNPGMDNYYNELRQYVNDSHFVGIKLHPYSNKKDMMCKEYMYTYDFAAEHELPVLIHTWGMNDIKRFNEISEKYPKTIIILGHSGGEEEALEEAIRIAANHENVFLDTACSYVWQGAIEAMVEGATAKKIVYGSDAYWNSMEAAIGRVVFANISDEEKKLILGENAIRLFKLSI